MVDGMPAHLETSRRQPLHVLPIHEAVQPCRGRGIELELSLELDHASFRSLPGKLLEGALQLPERQTPVRDVPQRNPLVKDARSEPLTAGSIQGRLQTVVPQPAVASDESRG